MIAIRNDDGGSEGERLKLEAHSLLEARRKIYVHRGRRVLLQTLLACGRATADNVRELVELPDGIDPVCLGAVPGPLAKAGIIRACGFEKTRRPAGHARPVTVWALANREAALLWLEANPNTLDSHFPQTPNATVAPAAPTQNTLF